MLYGLAQEPIVITAGDRDPHRGSLSVTVDPLFGGTVSTIT
jgi:hypothetical protein